MRFDTMVAAYCLNPIRAKPEPSGEGDWRRPLLSRAAKALGREGLCSSMARAGVLKLYDEVEMPLVDILRAMEREGIAVDDTGRFELSCSAGAYQLKVAGEPMPGPGPTVPVTVRSGHPTDLGDVRAPAVTGL